MRKIIAVTLLTLSLGGCAGMSLEKLQTVAHLGTASVANPVTRERLAAIEQSVTVVFAGLNTWKRLCVAGRINVDCKAQIGAVQVYTRQIPPYLTRLRTFVKTNDQVNAMVVFNQLTDILGDVKSMAARSGQQL